MTNTEILNELRKRETKKINACAEELSYMGYFTTAEMNTIMKEFGVARSYFEKMYHLEWCYVPVLRGSHTFTDFLQSYKIKLELANALDRDIIDYTEIYKVNKETGMIDEYDYEYRWKVSFKKRDSLNLYTTDI